MGWGGVRSSFRSDGCGLAYGVGEWVRGRARPMVVEGMGGWRRVNGVVGFPSVPPGDLPAEYPQVMPSHLVGYGIQTLTPLELSTDSL